MTTQNQLTPAQQAAHEEAMQFREEIRAGLKTIQSRIEQTTAQIITIENIQADERNTLDELTKAIETMMHGIKHAATATTPTAQTQKFLVTRIERETRKNKNYYRAYGPSYPKFGVRVWDEVFETLGYNLETIEWKDDYIFEISPPLPVTGVLGTYTDKETGEQKSMIQKVIGKA